MLLVNVHSALKVTIATKIEKALWVGTKTDQHHNCYNDFGKLQNNLRSLIFHDLKNPLYNIVKDEARFKLISNLYIIHDLEYKVTTH